MADADRLEHALRYYRRLERVHQFVSRHLAEEFRIEDVAKAAGIAPSYFSTFFHQKTGTPFHRWVTALRIDRSRTLLSERNYSVTEVAFSVGFSSVRTFERCFKELVGTTARDFRRQARQAFESCGFHKDSVAFLGPDDATSRLRDP